MNTDTCKEVMPQSSPMPQSTPQSTARPWITLGPFNKSIRNRNNLFTLAGFAIMSLILIKHS